MDRKVIYYTKTGHSKKIANSIGKELGMEALDIKENPKLQDVDLLFIVGGIYGRKSDPKLLQYIDTLSAEKVKKAVLMTSCISMKSPQDQVREKLKSKGIEVMKEEFICKGSFLVFGWGHPNNRDLQKALEFAKKYVADR